MTRLLTVFIAVALLGLCLGLSADEQVKDIYPDLASGALTSAKLVILPAGVLLRSGNLTITQKDLDAATAKAPKEILAQIRNNAFFILEDRATGDLLIVEAKKWAAQTGRKSDADTNSLVRAYFEALTSKTTVSDDEVKGFFAGNKAMLGDATFEQAKDQLRDYMLNQKRQQFVDAHIVTIGERTLVEVNKGWAARQYVLAMNNPVNKARKSGKPTFVDFGRDGCQPCAMMTPILAALKKEYAGKMNMLFINTEKEQILAARYGIEVVPVQILFDKSGKEVFRHEGFFAKEEIVSKLAEIGVK